ncbi:hypothetical protein AB0O01_36310 [Streptomyces sp. NPDC093252]|uniref:hypothetical protein n=1 Tax=Streptomyces sp. NPDC093252 TaxID=3154980 RepID=UPI00343C8EB9
MSLRKMFATAAVVGAVATAGLIAAPAAQAATPASASASTASDTQVGPTRWVPWGTYTSQGACFYAGNWAVMNAGASYFNCYEIAPGQWALELWRP